MWGWLYVMTNIIWGLTRWNEYIAMINLHLSLTNSVWRLQFQQASNLDTLSNHHDPWDISPVAHSNFRFACGTHWQWSVTVPHSYQSTFDAIRDASQLGNGIQFFQLYCESFQLLVISFACDVPSGNTKLETLEKIRRKEKITKNYNIFNVITSICKCAMSLAWANAIRASIWRRACLVKKSTSFGSSLVFSASCVKADVRTVAKENNELLVQ